MLSTPSCFSDSFSLSSKYSLRLFHILWMFVELVAVNEILRNGGLALLAKILLFSSLEKNGTIFWDLHGIMVG